MKTRWLVTAVATATVFAVPTASPAVGHPAWAGSAVVGHSAAAAKGHHSKKFRVTKVIVPKNLYANGPNRNMTIYWKGHATFPVRVLSKPRSCPAGLICDPVRHKFTKRADPLVWKNVAHCQGTVPAGFQFKYWLWMVDAKGHKTARVKTNTHCYQSSR